MATRRVARHVASQDHSTGRSRRWNLTHYSLVGGLALWTIAMVYSFLRPSLWILDLILVPMTWLCWIIGTVAMVFGACRLLRRDERSVGAIVPIVPAALIVVLVSATVGMWWQVSPRAWFTTHQGLYVRALDTDPGSGLYGNKLPFHLGFLTTNGRVSGTVDGARFFPQWIGIPDDAGGYWYSPHRSPAGRDMYGMMCTDPLRLDGDWWMCGLRG